MIDAYSRQVQQTGRLYGPQGVPRNDIRKHFMNNSSQLLTGPDFNNGIALADIPAAGMLLGRIGGDPALLVRQNGRRYLPLALSVPITVHRWSMAFWLTRPSAALGTMLASSSVQARLYNHLRCTI